MTLLRFGCLLLLSGLLEQAAAATTLINDIRFGRHDDGLYRVVLDLSAETRFFHSVNERGTVVLRLPEARAREGLRAKGFDPAFLRDMRINHLAGQGVEVLIEPQGRVTGRVFALKPYRQRGVRLVVDLIPNRVPAEQVPAVSAVPDQPTGDSPVGQAAERHDTAVPASAEIRATPSTEPKSQPLAAEHSEISFNGVLNLEGRWFPSHGNALQHRGYLSASLEPEWYWSRGLNSVSFTPFVRWDQHDGERSHGDIRELLYIHAGDGWELRAGVSKVFWGVTEAYHLVDIINQTDLVENPDGEQKLGQPMVKFSWEQDWGTWDLYWLPYFRERNYPGIEGRLQPPLPVATGLASYADGKDEWSPGWAVRWSHYVGDWDIGLSHFHGIGREPTLLPGLDGMGRPVLIPRYESIDQTGLDLQATKGNWLWKLEAVRRSGQGPSFYAATGGFEYTFVGIAESAADLGVLMELMYDERGDLASVPFNRDVFLGVRWTANDVDSSELLAGVIYDWRSEARLLNVEASRRIGAVWKLSLQARLWSSTEKDPLLAGFGQEDYVELNLARYF